MTNPEPPRIDVIRNPIIGAAAAQAKFNLERGINTVEVSALWLYSVLDELDGHRALEAIR